MSHWRRLAAQLEIVPDLRTAYAMDFLEQHGQRWCIHFGLANAVERAADLYITSLGAQWKV